MIEIERKFLVKNHSFIMSASSATELSQGFLSTDPFRTVRVRVSDSSGWITIKGIGSSDGTTRFEWEKAISLEEAKALLKLCKEGIIEKTRYEVAVGFHIFEIDVFKGLNEGLVVAEIELSQATDSFEKPAWLGEEVTGNTSYYNASLSEKPFKKW